jgi:tetratricopeptide (TPR) repeat protein
MKTMCVWGFFLVLLVWSTTPLLACLWDYDTLMMENERFPETLELVTGKFLRHSKEFYEWRVKDRTEKLAKESKASYYDDLAVAHEKLGNREKAIELMKEKDQKFPGLYETYANLGTFYLHGKQYTEGLAFIEKALKVNPNAHFGREISQKLLVEYVLHCQKAGKTVPLNTENSSGFAGFVQEHPQAKEMKLNSEAVLKGVLGMMKFGNHESPVLLEVLGDLLSQGVKDDAKQLAARAYLKAAYAYEEENPELVDVFAKKAKAVLAMQMIGKEDDPEKVFKMLEDSFTKELEEGKTWFDKVHQDEKNWVAEGKNPEEAFAQKYYQAPRMAHEKQMQRNQEIETGVQTLQMLQILGIAVAFSFIILAMMRLKRVRIAESKQAEAKK